MKRGKSLKAGKKGGALGKKFRREGESG